MTIPLRDDLFPKDGQFATKIGSGEFHDLNSMNPCTLLYVTAGNDHRQGGVFKGAGTFPDMYALYKERGRDNLHIRLPNGLYFPDDYIEHPEPQA